MKRFYTRTGDDGYTGFLGEGRLPKYDLRIETLGALDEATAALGVARSQCCAPQSGPLILAIQRDLYHLMAETSAAPANAARFRQVDAARVAWLEEQTDALSQVVTVPREFIVPGDCASAAALDLARAVVRRAERRVAQLLHEQQIENPQLLLYLNRLSSLCFVLELLENQSAGHLTPTLANSPH